MIRYNNLLKRKENPAQSVTVKLNLSDLWGILKDK